MRAERGGGAAHAQRRARELGGWPGDRGRRRRRVRASGACRAPAPRGRGRPRRRSAPWRRARPLRPARRAPASTLRSRAQAATRPFHLAAAVLQPLGGRGVAGIAARARGGPAGWPGAPSGSRAARRSGSGRLDTHTCWPAPRSGTRCPGAAARRPARRASGSRSTGRAWRRAAPRRRAGLRRSRRDGAAPRARPAPRAGRRGRPPGRWATSRARRPGCRSATGTRSRPGRAGRSRPRSAHGPHWPKPLIET